MTMKATEFLLSLIFVAFFTSNEGVKIRCTYSIENWSSIGSLYFCTGRIISYENPSIVTEISGSHLAGKRNSDVTGFYFENQPILTSIPKGLEKFSGNVQVFRWRNGSLTTIDSSITNAFQNLKHFSLSNNKLVSIDENLFQKTRRLQQIWFGGNLLQHVKYNLLSGLYDLRIVSFAENTCINIRAESPYQIKELIRQLEIRCPQQQQL